MKCKDCKFQLNIGNTNDSNKALCSFPESYILINPDDDCHFVPAKTELKCRDCDRLGNDNFCIGQKPYDSAYDEINGEIKLCSQFIDKEEPMFMKILMHWKANGTYDRNKINQLIDEFEERYAKLAAQ
jgi:hypothetical protein